MPQPAVAGPAELEPPRVRLFGERAPPPRCTPRCVSRRRRAPCRGDLESPRSASEARSTPRRARRPGLPSPAATVRGSRAEAASAVTSLPAVLQLAVQPDVQVRHLPAPRGAGLEAGARRPSARRLLGTWRTRAPTPRVGRGQGRKLQSAGESLGERSVGERAPSPPKRRA